MLGPDGPSFTAPEELRAQAAKGRLRTLPIAALMHGTGQFAAFNALFGGGAVVLSPDRHFDPGATCRLIAAKRVQFVSLGPGQRLHQHGRREGLPRRGGSRPRGPPERVRRPRTVVFRDSVRRSVTGKPDYAWARAEAQA